MLTFATGGLVANLIGILVPRAGSRDSLDVRGAARSGATCRTAPARRP